jgi:hypothetical protein
MLSDKPETAPEHIGNDVFRAVPRHEGQFLCPAGHTAHLSDANLRDYNQGHAVAIRCTQCPASGRVQSKDAADGLGLA